LAKSPILLAALVALAAGAAAPGPVARAPQSEAARSGTVIAPIRGPLSESMLALTVRAIRRAHQANAAAIVFEIDTEGGEVGLMDRLIDEIERAQDLRTIAFVTQKAASAGALIAISCQRVYMKPGSNIGSALVLAVPHFFSPDQLPQVIGGGDPSIAKKTLGHYRAHFRAKAQANGRPGALAEAMVFAETDVYEVEVAGDRRFVNENELRDLIAAHGESAVRKIRDIAKKGDVLNLTAQEAQATGLIDGLAVSREDLLEQLGLAGAPVVEIEPSWSERFAELTQSFGIVLLIGGLIAIFIEIKAPGFGVPGLVGIALLALWMFGKYLAGLAEITEILLIVAGFALIAVEIFVLPGMLISGIVGVIAILAGLVLASQQTFLPQPERPFAEASWWSNVRTLALGITLGVIGMIAVAHFFPSIPFLNRAILRAGSSAAVVPGGTAFRPLDEVDLQFRPQPGARGVARTVLRPAGKVAVEGRELDAVSEGPFVDRGQPVVVVRVEAAHVVVRLDGGASA
jgi:membrane-bound serine protease (ClpP class)